MTSSEIVRQRIINQQLAGTKFKSAKEIVKWMGAMQAQDYAMAKWAIATRLTNSTDEIIERAINAGEIIRTHVMRPTWHFVSSNDVRWMLALTAPHIRSGMKSNHKSLGLTDQLFKRSNSIIEKSLAKDGCMTRAELVAELNKKKIKPDNLQALHIMLNAELNGTICNGPMRGKQFTYALLDERVPITKPLKRDEALAELSLRYFKSHGPANVQDFKWWSGLPVADAKEGLELRKSNLVNEKLENQTYWFSNSLMIEADLKPIYFLPAYDEFMVSYKDRSACLDAAFFSNAITGNGIFKPIIVMNGKVIGIWARAIQENRIIIETQFFRSSNKLKKKEMILAFQPYGKFLQREIKVT